MATNINKQTAPGFWSTTGLAVTMTVADVGAGNETAAVNDVLLIARNSHATNPFTVTITSAADQYGRLGNVAAQSLVAGEIRIFRLTMHGWADVNGKYLFSANNAAILFGVVQL